MYVLNCLMMIMALVEGMPLEKVDALFGITTWRQYAQFVRDNLR